MRIYLKQGSKNYPFSCKKINALTSDGWVYDENGINTKFILLEVILIFQAVYF